MPLMRPPLPAIGADPSLAWLLAPLTTETFLDDVWAKDHYHVKRNRPDYFGALLPGESAVDELLDLFRHEPSAVRLVKGKDKKSSDRHRLADGSLDLAAIRHAFADGYTIVLDGVEQYVRAVGTLARSLEVDLHFPIQVNTYVTPPMQTGLAPHYDEHDVLILQVEGSKIWHLYGGADMPAHAIHRDTDTGVDVNGLPPPIDIDLQAGDVLYVPRGRVHAAETAAEQSVHLTVGLHAPTVLMLAIGALYAQSFRDDLLNARLPPRHLDNPALDTALRDLVREAFATADSTEAMAGGQRLLADVLVRRGTCPPVGKVSDTTAIDGQTRVRKYQPLYSHVTSTEGGVTLQFAGLSVNAGLEHEAALRFLSRSTEPFRVGDLPGLLPRQQTDLARSLIVSGFLVRLPDRGPDRQHG